jgi:hypothetical protein
MQGVHPLSQHRHQIIADRHPGLMQQAHGHARSPPLSNGPRLDQNGHTVAGRAKHRVTEQATSEIAL